MNIAGSTAQQLFFSLLAVSYLACSEASPPSSPDEGASGVGAAAGEDDGAGGVQDEGAGGDTSAPIDLLEKARSLDYRNWTRAPGFAVRQPSQGPHAASVDIYVNDVVVDALGGPSLSAFPDGSFIVKDGFDGDELALIALMEKRAGAWEYAEYYGADEQKYTGTVDVCVTCHAAGSDFVRAFSLP
jgi:hypothetical protein